MREAYPGREADTKLVVRILICDSVGRILLQQRASEAGYGMWSLPGGKPDPGESEETAVTRETHEETGLTIEGLRYIDEHSADDWTSVLYEATAYRGELTMDERETMGLAWFFPQDIDPAMLAFDQDRYFLEQLTTYER